MSNYKPELIDWVQSPQSDNVVDKAIEKYKWTRVAKECYVYSRVVADHNWAVLQYHYFYTFNDYRTNAEGINNHEGDWEMVAVFLKNDNSSKEVEDFVPFGVACSQHENGQFRFWDQESFKIIGNRPKIFVALGSHANYFKANENIPTEFQFSGTIRRIVSVIDNILKWVHDGEEGLPPEKVDGKHEDNNQIKWVIVPISDTEPEWVNYGGLWGQETNHPNESGPTGPKWKRMEIYKKLKQKENVTKATKKEPSQEQDEQPLNPEKRLRWGLHGWKDILLLEMVTSADKPINDRKMALKTLAEN